MPPVQYLLTPLLAFDAEATYRYRATTLVRNRLAACLVLAERRGLAGTTRVPCCGCDRERAILLFDFARVVKVVHLLLVLLFGNGCLHGFQFRFGASAAGSVVGEPVEDVLL